MSGASKSMLMVVIREPRSSVLFAALIASCVFVLSNWRESGKPPSKRCAVSRGSHRLHPALEDDQALARRRLRGSSRRKRESAPVAEVARQSLGVLSIELSRTCSRRWAGLRPQTGTARLEREREGGRREVVSGALDSFREVAQPEPLTVLCLARAGICFLELLKCHAQRLKGA